MVADLVVHEGIVLEARETVPDLHQDQAKLMINLSFFNPPA
jgi:hypothetical protein